MLLGLATVMAKVSLTARLQVRYQPLSQGALLRLSRLYSKRLCTQQS